MMLVRLAGLAAVTVLTALGAPAAAQSDAAAQALIDRLKPGLGSGTRGLMPEPAAAAGRTTVITVAPLRSAAARSPLPGRPAELTDAAPSVSITITFASASAIVNPDAERALAPLGRALASSELSPYRFRIEGHTDSVGDAALNQALSERRAAAVRDHLVTSHGVDPRRLISVGFGASQLLVPTPPQTPDARNRRVQVVNLGS